MTWIAGKRVSPGSPIKESDIEDIINNAQDLIDIGLGFQGFMGSFSQSISNNSSEQVISYTTEKDPNSVESSGNFTPPFNGYARCTAYFNGAGNNARFDLLRSGGTFLGCFRHYVDGIRSDSVRSAWFPVTTGQTYGVFIFHNSGAARTYTGRVCFEFVRGDTAGLLTDRFYDNLVALKGLAPTALEWNLAQYAMEKVRELLVPRFIVYRNSGNVSYTVPITGIQNGFVTMNTVAIDPYGLISSGASGAKLSRSTDNVAFNSYSARESIVGSRQYGWNGTDQEFQYINMHSNWGPSDGSVPASSGVSIRQPTSTSWQVNANDASWSCVEYY